MFGQSLLSAFGSAACTTDTDQLFTTDVQTTSVATYQFNNATTSIPNNTYPGTWAVAAIYATGKFGNAASFSGSNYITLNGFTSTTTFSYSFWVRPTNATSSGYKAIIGNQTSGGQLFTDAGALKIYASGTLTFSGSPTLADNTWSHVALSVSNGTGTIYINGINKGTASSLALPSTSYIATASTQVGVGTYNYRGKIDQLRIFDTALPQSAVTALYNETTTTATYPYVDYVDVNPNSVAYYKMSDASDSVTHAEFATWDPNLVPTPNLYNGNLRMYGGSTANGIGYSNQSVSSGKHYWEHTVTAIGSESSFGIARPGDIGSHYYVGGSSTSWGLYVNGNIYHNSVNLGAYMSGGFSNGDIIGAELDLDNGTLKFYKNGTGYGNAFTGLTGTFLVAAEWRTSGSANDHITNFGASSWAYNPSTGFVGVSELVASYNGTATNVNFNTEGKFGFAGAFNGSSSWMDLRPLENALNGGYYSFSVWVNPASITDNQIIFLTQTLKSNFGLALSNSVLSFYQYDSSVSLTEITYTGLQANTWTHIVGLWDGSNIKLYINGSPEGSAAITSIRAYQSNIFAIGKYVNNTRYFNGLIDQIRIYDSAISAENVTTLYNEIECPELEFLADYLVIAGGGGTTHGAGSGGGAGGYRTSYGTSGGGASAETILRLDKSVAYTVTVGAGGIGNQGSNQLLGGQGQDSIFSGITSSGGGKGTAQSVGYPNGPGGQLGGSGSGGARNNTSPGAGTANQGFAGGAGNNSANAYAGGGGGGASSVGLAANSTSAGNGGNGISSTITGTAVSRAGGGGGAVYDGAIGVGTSGGGSGGTSAYTPFTAPTPGTANTGGGGGGGNDASKGQDGGSGVVILRYKTANISSFAVTGTLNTPTPSIVGTDSVLIFTTGTGTVTFS